MRGPGGGLALAVLAGVLAAAAGHAGTEAGGGAGAAAVTRARCAARCLGLRLRGGPGEVGSLAQCGEHAECAKCLQPCREARELEAHECEAYCEQALFPAGRGSECLTSCAFLASARRVKQGACPAPARARGFQAACVEGCAADADCAGPRRCCPNGCGRTCRDPRRPFRGVPLRPGRALRLLPRGPGRLGLRWSSRFSVSAEPVVYVVQRRAGPGPPGRPPTPRPAWATVAETTEERAELRDIRPGRWYQFRVAAVNAQGTRGFTAPSPPFRAPEGRCSPPRILPVWCSPPSAPAHVLPPADPAPPPAPSSLRLTAGSSGSTARLAWDPPARDPDVPIHHYRVAWGPDGGERTRGTADGRRPELLLDGLRPGLLYAVELQAVAHWGPTRLRSPRARLRFRAPHPAPLEPSGKPRPPQEVGPPFLLDGRLRATVRWPEPQGLNATRFRVRWTPRACARNRTAPTGAWAEAATRHPHLTLDGLAFSCSYQVRVLPGGPGFEFDTPACADLDPAARCGD
ncbi:anosmin-1 [Perognathus longimembris pacificus]|uniref:anosmin-1 n=1 Tax=Perognathus longimembris pacificus TaxID=214514 RepID=UPI0020188869|nr:anosmin-1 [Perognathus longimembris pacificus]